jgi:hypothetical protein
MTPPPVLEDRKASGRPVISASQSITCVSSSVQAGLVAQSMPCTPSPEDSRSPRMEGPEPLAGKKAKKLGDCQWVMPGRIFSSISARIRSKGSGCSGGCAGREARIWPGAALESTGKLSRRSW